MEGRSPSELASGILRRGDSHLINDAPRSNSPISNVNPDVYLTSSKPVIGSDTFGHGKSYQSWHEPIDKTHRNFTSTSGVIRDELLIYRSSALAPREDSPAYRIRGASVTTPSNGATFVDGTKGDIY